MVVMSASIRNHDSLHNTINYTQVYSKTDIILLRLVLMFFKLMGLAPFRLKVITKIQWNIEKKIMTFMSSWWGSGYNVILSLGYLFTTLYLSLSFENDNREMIRIIGCCVGFSIVPMIFVLRQRNLVKVVNQLVQINTELADKLSNFPKSQNVKFKQIRIFLLYFIGNSVFIIQSLKSNSQQIIYTINLAFFSSTIIQYALILIYLEKQIHKLNQSLELLSNPVDQLKQQHKKLLAASCKIILKDLLLIRKSHRNIFEISCEISDIYSKPALIVTTGLCLQLIIISYETTSAFMLTIEQISFFHYFRMIFWMLNFGFPIVILTGCVTKLVAEVCNIFSLI